MRRLTMIRAESFLGTQGTFFSSIILDISQGGLIRSESVSEKGSVTWISRGIHARHAPKQCSVSEMHGQVHLTLRMRTLFYLTCRHPGHECPGTRRVAGKDI